MMLWQRLFFICFLCSFSAIPANAQLHQDITYTRSDSLRVVALLREAQSVQGDTCLPLFFAHRLLGIPYVAATLEVNEKERLVVNLRQLDCYTLVENVVALVLSVRDAEPTFATYCRYLRSLRYVHGQLNGYASRNHYFSEWIDSNTHLGWVKELQGCEREEYKPFVAQQKLNLYFMSTHPELYPRLKNFPDRVKQVRENELKFNGKVVRYIPKKLLNQGKEELGCIQDGDILAIVTRKAGLDTSHLGLAVWKNGKLHFLHASSLRKRVVLEPTTLAAYMAKHPSQIGVRVVRIQSSFR